MADKTYTTAAVIIPPEEVWEPIQSIRQVHDRAVRRWMPHVTLLYPFRPREEFAALAAPLEGACRTIRPFEIELAEFRCFRRGRGNGTMWLAPEPTEALSELHEALWKVVPDCDDVRQFANGYTPHLSVGQAAGAKLKELLDELQAGWTPLRFRAEGVSLIWRSDPPDDVFRVDRTIVFGG